MGPSISLGDLHILVGPVLSVLAGVFYWGWSLSSKKNLPGSSMGSISLEYIHGTKGMSPAQNVNLHLILFLSHFLVSLSAEPYWFSIFREETSCFLQGQGRDTHQAVGQGEGSITYAHFQQFFGFLLCPPFHLHKHQEP